MKELVASVLTNKGNLNIGEEQEFSFELEELNEIFTEEQMSPSFDPTKRQILRYQEKSIARAEQFYGIRAQLAQWKSKKTVILTCVSKMEEIVKMNM